MWRSLLRAGVSRRARARTSIAAACTRSGNAPCRRRAYHLRRAGSREMHGAPPDHQHAAAGSGAAERSDLCRSRARSGATRAHAKPEAIRRRASVAFSARLPRAALRQAETRSSARPRAAARWTTTGRSQPRPRSWSPSASRKPAKLEASRTGRVDHGGQHHPESGRNDHQGIAMDITQASVLLADQHRHWHRRARLAAHPGWLRRGGHHQRDGRAAGPAAFCAQGETRHLPAPVRRSLADRSVRLQAEARQVRTAPNCPTPSGMGQRITGMTSGQSSFPVARSIFNFKQHGKSGTWVSELLPHTAKIVDDIAIIKIDEHRRDQSRSGDHLHSERQPAAGPAQHGRVGQLRSGQREPEPAGVCRDALAGATR